MAQAPSSEPADQPSRTHARIHAGPVLVRWCLGETLQTDVLANRGEDGHDENWEPTPARWPLPRHCFARLVFTARSFSYVGSLLERQGQGNPLRLWGQRRGDRRGTDSHWTAEPAIGENSLDDTKAYRDQMRGSSRL